MEGTQEITLEQALAKIKELEGNQAESDKLVGELTQELSNAQASAELSPVVVVTHEGQQYRVLAPKFRHKKVEYNAADLSKNADVVKELVEAESDLLQLVVKPAAAKSTPKAKANASK